MATLLFGLAGLLALISFTVLPNAPSLVSLGGGGGGGGHVVVSHDPSEDSTEIANRRVAEALARKAAEPVNLAPGPGEAVSFGDPGASSPVQMAASDEMPAADQGHASPQPAAAPSQPAAPPPARVQAAPQVSFVPGQPMMDTNPSR